MSLATIQSGVSQGIMWAVLTLGVYLTFRTLEIADLTVEGTFPLGAAVTVVLINAGVHPIIAAIVAFISGMCAGLVSGVLITAFKIPPILSGILTQIALYSVNIRIMSDRATVSIAGNSFKNIVTNLFPDGTAPNTVSICVGFAICALLIAIFYRFFGTEIGCAIRATGNNRHMARALGINTDWTTILCLMISNGLVAFSGNLIAQFDYGSALVNMGQGTIVIGLASIIIGEVLFLRKEHNFAYILSSVVLGSVIYRTIIAVALTIPGMKATDLKLITAVIVAIALALPVLKTKVPFFMKAGNEEKEEQDA